MSGREGKRSVRRFLRSAAVFAISAGAVFALLLCAQPSEAFSGMKALLISGFSPAGMQKTLLSWPLLLLTGLSVGCAWKTGFLHLGAPGQFTLGAFAAMSGALLLKLPWWVCLMLAALGGAVGGWVLSLIKNRTRLAEVLSAVMLNYTALCLTQWLWEDGLSGAAETASISSSALPVFPLGNQNAVSVGLPIALLLCAALWIVFKFTGIGYEVKAGGSSREAARRAGMPVERNRKLALALSGMLSGLAGGICLLSGMTDTALSVISVRMGYVGIAAAMLSFAHPIGIMAASLAAAGILTGSEALPPVYPQETGMLLLALTLLGSAATQRKNRKQKSKV